jgi:hypothetical protein
MTKRTKGLLAALVGLGLAAAVAVPVIANQGEDDGECHSAIVCSLRAGMAKLGMSAPMHRGSPTPVDSGSR